VTNENSNDVSVINLGDRTVTATVPVGNAPRKIVVQPGPMAAMPGMPAVAAATQAPSAPVASNPAASTFGIASFAFSPRTATVKAGQMVTVTNNDAVAHTSTGTAWDSGDIQPGGSYAFAAPMAPGTYDFHCSIHPFMTGTLIVQ